MSEKDFLKRKIEELQRMEVKNVSFDAGKVKFEFDGSLIENEVKVVEHEVWVGSHHRKVPIVYVDNDVPPKYVPSLCIHEAVEKYVGQRYGLSTNAEGHELAEDVERRFFLKQGLTEADWEEYAKVAERIHREEFDYITKHLFKFSQKHKQLPKEINVV